MPLYTYQSEDGDTFDVQKDMKDAPRFGHTLRRKGKLFRRIPVLPTKPTIPEYRFKSPQVELFDPAAPYHSKEGEACFTSKNEVREFVAAKRGGAKSPHDLVWGMEGRGRDGIKPRKK